jgi:hypothetical protein
VALDRGSRFVYEITESGAISLVSDSLRCANPVDLIVEKVTRDYLPLAENAGLFRIGPDGS